MRQIQFSLVVVAIALLIPAVPRAQQDPDRAVAGGGVTAPGWTGQVDPAAAKQGKSIKDSKFEQRGDALHLSIGPAAVYWNPANTVSGNYSVKATFREAKAAADHPHPYGIFIGGQNLDTDAQTLMYCVAYSDGSFLVRAFNGPTVTTIAKRQPHDAVQKVAADGSVSNEVGWSVRDGRAECLINGTAVASFDRAEITGPDRLESTDGVYGLRVSHNVDVVVTGFGLTKP